MRYPDFLGKLRNFGNFWGNLMGSAAVHRIDSPRRPPPMMKNLSLTLLLLLPLSPLIAEIKAPAKLERIVLIGNGLGERMIDHPYLETNFQLSFPKENLYIRNLCRPGDTPGFRPHPSRKTQWAFPGAEKFHPQHQHKEGEGFYPTTQRFPPER